MSLIRTIGGLTPTEPYKTMKILGFDIAESGGPSPSEYEEWRELTKRLTSLVYEHLYILGKCEEKIGQFTVWNEHVDHVRELWNEAQEMENPFSLIFSIADFSSQTAMTTRVSRMIEICIDAVCAMEKIDGAILTYGCLVPKEIATGFDTPGGVKKGMGIVGTLAVVAVTGGLIYGVVVLARKSGNDSSGEAAA